MSQSFKRFVTALEFQLDAKSTANPQEWDFADLLDLLPHEKVSAWVSQVVPYMNKIVYLSNEGSTELNLYQSYGGDEPIKGHYVVLLDMMIDTDQTCDPDDWNFAALLDLGSQYSLSAATYDVTDFTNVALQIRTTSNATGKTEACITMTGRPTKISKEADYRQAEHPLPQQKISDFMPSEHRDGLATLERGLEFIALRASTGGDGIKEMVDALKVISAAIKGDASDDDLCHAVNKVNALMSASAFLATPGGAAGKAQFSASTSSKPLADAMATVLGLAVVNDPKHLALIAKTAQDAMEAHIAPKVLAAESPNQ